MPLQHDIAGSHAIYEADGSISIRSLKKTEGRFRRLFMHGLIAATFGIACVTPASAAQPLVPALLEPASPEHHVGKIVFVELVTPDLALAKQFYGNLFGWTFVDMNAGGTTYSQASLDGRPVAGLVHKPVMSGERRQPAWLSFIAVRDVDATKAAALQHGARILSEPHGVPNRGREAVFADPQGAVFAVLASSSGDPADELAAPGEWIWSSLITSDPDTDAAFYQTLFDYEVFALPGDAGAQHLMLATDNYARASANSLPTKDGNVHPHWLNYIRVVDAAKMSEKAVALGGQVLVAPRIDRHGEKVAIIADPSGAPLGLLEWQNTDSKEVNK